MDTAWPVKGRQGDPERPKHNSGHCANSFFRNVSPTSNPRDGEKSERCELSRLVHCLSEAAADMRIRQQVFGIRWVVFDLHADLPNEGAQILQFIAIFRSPNRA